MMLINRSNQNQNENKKEKGRMRNLDNEIDNTVNTFLNCCIVLNGITLFIKLFITEKRGE
jgi:hypothetical protein